MNFLPTACFVFLLFSTLSNFGQTQSAQHKQADSLYLAGNFETAGLLYEKVLLKDSINAEVLHRRGTCFSHLERPLEAEPYFKQALQIDSNYAKSYYNLGLIRAKNDQFEEGLAFFKAFHQLEPLDSDGPYNIAFAFASLSQKDSFDTYFKLALELEPHMLYAYENGPEAYLFFGENSKAEYFMEKGLLQFPNEAGLYKKAISLYEKLGDTKRVLDVYQRGKKQFPSEFSWYLGTAIKRVKVNTSPEVFISSPSKPKKFRNLSISQLSKMDAWVKDKKGGYRYADLMKKWESTPKEITWDEYFMLYYGHSKQKDFDPTGTEAQKRFDTFQILFEAGDYEEALLAIEDAIQLAPTQFGMYYWKASCLKNMNDLEGFELAIQDYYGFALGILHTGDGTSFETAYLTTNYADKFAIMELLNLKSSDTMDVQHEGSLFSILIDQEEETERKVCFWIGN